MRKLSPSALSLLLDCPRCFWLQNNGVKRPAGIMPSLPSGMDLLLKRHFDSYRGKGLPPALAGLKGVKLFTGPELREWQNNRKGMTWADGNGNVLKGAVDEILEKDGKLIVLDFKTRGFPRKDDTAARYQHQLDTYTFLLRKNGKKTEDYAYLLFFHPTAVGRDQRVSFHADLVKMAVSPENAERLFRKALAVLAGRMPPAAEDCDYCGFRTNRT